MERSRAIERALLRQYSRISDTYSMSRKRRPFRANNSVKLPDSANLMKTRTCKIYISELSAGAGLTRELLLIADMTSFLRAPVMHSFAPTIHATLAFT